MASIMVSVIVVYPKKIPVFQKVYIICIVLWVLKKSYFDRSVPQLHFT